MVHYCFKFQKIFLSLSRSKRRANIPILRKISFVHAQFMRVPNLHTAPKRHLIKIRTFLKKIDFIWKNINLQDVLKGLDSTKFLEILHSNKTPNKLSNHQFKIASIKIQISIQILCASHFKFVRKYAPPSIQNT